MGVPTAISYFFGGTSLLILVGVVLDTMKQIESHLLMKRYEGFMKKGKVRARMTNPFQNNNQFAKMLTPFSRRIQCHA